MAPYSFDKAIDDLSMKQVIWLTQFNMTLIMCIQIILHYRPFFRPSPVNPEN